MALDRVDKERIVAEVSEQFARAVSVLVAEYSGTTVRQLTELRRLAREGDVSVRVVKNTLARMAARNTSFAPLTEVLRGQVVLAFSHHGPGEAAKIFRRLIATGAPLKVVGISLGAAILPGSDLSRVARLPNYEESLALLIAAIQAPMAKLVRTVDGVPGKLVRTLAALKQSREAV